jgi:hypothetical protein
MRKRTDLEPRLMALTQAELAAERTSRSWIPQAAGRLQMDPTRWSRRARQESFWRMDDHRANPRSVH